MVGPRLIINVGNKPKEHDFLCRGTWVQGYLPRFLRTVSSNSREPPKKGSGKILCSSQLSAWNNCGGWWTLQNDNSKYVCDLLTFFPN